MISSSIIAIIAALFFIELFRYLALRWQLVDRPGGRKQHAEDVPLIGGIAIFFSLCVTLLSSSSLSIHDYLGLLAGASLLLVIGIVDDYRELNSRWRLLGQAGAALILIFVGHMRVVSLDDLLFFNHLNLMWWSIPLTVILVVGFLNAMNMIDGQDGLAGGVALGQVVLLGYLCWQTQRQMDLAILLLLGLVLGVFLIFNVRLPWRKHAAIFLGDAGSTSIAFTVAWFAIAVGQQGAPIKPIVMLWLLAFPVFDLFQVTWVRFKHKKPLLMPSLDHFHHLLRSAGCEASLSTTLLVGLSLGLGIIGILFNDWQVPSNWQFLAWLLALAGYLWFTQFMRRRV